MKIFLSGCESGDGMNGIAHALPILAGERERMKIFLSGTEGGRGNAQEWGLKILMGERESDMKIFLSGCDNRAQMQGINQLVKKECELFCKRDNTKIFLSDCEHGAQAEGIEVLAEDGRKEEPLFLWNLVSFYYMKSKPDCGILTRDNSAEILVDSGAFSFIGKTDGKGIDFDKYVDEYCQFIRDFDRPNVIGYFEMDIGCIVGYDKVLEYRRKLESITDKIIPVWHHYLGIPEFVKMCKESKSRIVAVTGCHNEIKDEDYIRFLKTAHQYGCKLHCLGMTNKKILDTVPFDYTDSASWVMGTVFGRIAGHKQKINQDYAREKRGEVFAYAYLQGMKMQKQYYQKWRHISRD